MPRSPAFCKQGWTECTAQLAQTNIEALQLLQVRRLHDRMPQLSSQTGTTIREVNLQVIASFLGNLN